MQILKGTLLGLGIFLVLSVIWFLFGLRYQLGIPKGQFAVSAKVLRALTIANPVFWAAFTLCLIIGYVIVVKVSAGALK